MLLSTFGCFSLFDSIVTEYESGIMRDRRATTKQSLLHQKVQEVCSLMRYFLYLKLFLTLPHFILQMPAISLFERFLIIFIFKLTNWWQNLHLLLLAPFLNSLPLTILDFAFLFELMLIFFLTSAEFIFTTTKTDGLIEF